MVELLSGIIGALAAGALAKTGEVGGRIVTDSYDSLRALMVRKLGKGGAVQSVEDEPRSEAAQTALAEALTNANLSDDSELAEYAEVLRLALVDMRKTDASDIDVGNITAHVNVLVSHLSASGKIKIGNIVARTGSATVSGIQAGLTKKA